jgi:hypothetical protein
MKLSKTQQAQIEVLRKLKQMAWSFTNRNVSFVFEEDIDNLIKEIENEKG